MNLPEFTGEQLTTLINNISPLYDVCRLVDPGKCSVIDPLTGKRKSGQNECFKVWSKERRCKSCTSYRSVMAGRVQDKTEIIDIDAFRVISVPLKYKNDDGTANVYCLELVKKASSAQNVPPEEDPDAQADTFNSYEGINVDPRLTTRILSVAGNNVSTGIICYDSNSTCIFANKSAFRLFHVQNDLSQLQKVLDQWVELNYHERVGNSWNQFFLYHGRELLYQVQYYEIKDSKNKLLGSYYSINDLTPLAQNHSGTRYREIHDELTGIYNLKGFHETVRSHLNSDINEPHTMIFLNCIDFKLINQLFGIPKGNEVLRAIAVFCKKLAGEGDVYGRLGGDNFALLINSSRYDEQKLIELSKEVTGMISSSFYRIKLQVGIYEISDPNENISSYIEKAAMAGKSTISDSQISISVFTDDILDQAVFANEIISGFDKAMSDRELCIFLQPQNDKNGLVFGAEALARWIHPEMGLIPPGKFIGILENANIIHHMDKYIWEQAASQLSVWKGTHYDKMKLSVNISPKDIYYLDIEKIFSDIIDKYRLSPDKINLEITESAVISNPEKSIDLVRQLRKRGFTVEIDDFGSGYSSLNLLKDIDANILKIDMGFLRKSDHNERAEIILSHIIHMAEDLKMEVITEGVETKDQLDMLSRLGCKMFQGYYFSKPIPVPDFENKYPM
ncbi:MAG: bifunctional diguanylate cyclase/phosphodiesterase [Lachnospiraceae bacterium]|nr:bifunctional diguanylate cyclase/phosphodiesterase [Lachnospiraceae bacterium]